jgi:chemotaxis protein methyltransferase CheR
MRAELHCLHAFLLNSARQHQAGLVAARRALYLDHGLAMAHLAHGAALAGSGDVRNARRAFFAAARLLERLPPDAVVPASDGERADALAALARAELELLAEAAA